MANLPHSFLSAAFYCCSTLTLGLLCRLVDQLHLVHLAGALWLGGVPPAVSLPQKSLKLINCEYFFKKTQYCYSLHQVCKFARIQNTPSLS